MSGANTKNLIKTAQAAMAVTLTAKNRTSAASAVTAVSYNGNDLNYIQALATAAGVTLTYRGNDENALDAVVASVAALSTV